MGAISPIKSHGKYDYLLPRHLLVLEFSPFKAILSPPLLKRKLTTFPIHSCVVWVMDTQISWKVTFKYTILRDAKHQQLPLRSKRDAEQEWAGSYSSWNQLMFYYLLQGEQKHGHRKFRNKNCFAFISIVTKLVPPLNSHLNCLRRKVIGTCHSMD